MTTDYDAIVIGSGMGGMTTAAALARFDHKVALLEQAPYIGGLTHAFFHDGFSWDVGLHYCGTFGQDEPAGRILDWLSGGAIEFCSVGPVYDTLHFPGDFEIPVSSPGDVYRSELKSRFPDHAAEIDLYFAALSSADGAMRPVIVGRSIPKPFRKVHRWWNRKEINHWCARTTGEVIGEIISDPKLASILSAQWGTYGGKPNEASFAFHATVIGHYLEGARYPAGGAGAISKALVPVIEGAGGTARAATPVEQLLIEDGSVKGVRTSNGEVFNSPVVVSAIGAGETVQRLLPEEYHQQDWVGEITSLKPSICNFQLFLGFEGDIAQHGATRSNHWFYESWDTTNAAWSDVERDPVPMMFVSFPSLKDVAHDPGPSNKHTGEVMILADWSTVAEFADGGKLERPAEWAAFKESVKTKLLTCFFSKFPSLEPLVAHSELATPLATVTFTGHKQGGFYGVETTPRRLFSQALSARTPIPGLFLSGQDVLSPGIAGSLWGGMLSAAAIDPRVFRKFK